MKARDFLPPILTQAAAALRRSLASDFSRAIDADDSGSVHAQRLSRPYAQSAHVHAAINLIAGELAGLPLKFYAGDAEYADPALVAWWNAPALGPKTAVGAARSRLTLSTVLRSLAAWAKLEGEFFLLLDDAWLLTAGRPSPASLPPFLIAVPARVQLILQGGAVAGYRYTDSAGHQSTWLPEQVIHWKAWNPYDDFRGLGALQAAKVAAEASYYIGTYIRELARNNGDQGYIVAAKHGVTDDAQREQIVADLRAKRAALRRGVPRDLFISTEISVDHPTQQAAGADLQATKLGSQEEIFVAFGVPPSMAQAKSQFSLGKDSDRYQLITGQCQPLGRDITQCLARVASLMAGVELTADLDWDDHPVLVEVRNSRVETALKLWGVGMPMASANQFLGLGMKPFAGWDRGYLPFSVQPVDAPEPAPTEDPALAEPGELPTDDSIAAVRALVLTRMRCAAVAPAAAPADPFAIFACTCGASAPVAPATARSAQQRTAWEAQMSRRRPTLKAFASAFGRVLMQARAETLAKITAREKSAAAGATVCRAAASDFLFELNPFAIALKGAMERQHRAALDLAGSQLFSELSKDDPFTYPPAKAVQFIRERLNKLSGVPDEIHARIKATLEAGIEAGDTTAHLAARIRVEFNAIDEGRARVIASTETGAAYGVARAEAMVQAGVQWKAWLTSGNANVRAAHHEAGLTYSYDTPIALDAPFIVGGEALMHPGDPSGTPANVINCHCVSIAVAGPGDTSA